MAAVLDAPVAAVRCEYLLGVCLFRGAAGDAVGELCRSFPGCFFDALAFDGEGLSDVGEVEVVVQRCGDPDPAVLDTSVFEGGLVNEIRLLSMLEMQGDILKELGLVGFDGEVVVCLPVLDQVGGELVIRMGSVRPGKVANSCG